jgi:hypothetical protein
MVSTIRFRSFKTVDLQERRSYTVLMLIGLVFAAVFAEPRIVLVSLSYADLLSAFVELVVSRVRQREPEPAQLPPAPQDLPKVVEHRPRF